MSPTVHIIIYTIIAILLLGTGGNLACRLLFFLTALQSPTVIPTDPKAGRVIGWLERIVLAAGVITGTWAIIAAVIALKTVARFKELDKQISAEYFLVGSLFSLIWAVLIANTWLAYDVTIGENMIGELRPLLGSSGKAGEVGTCIGVCSS